MIEYSKDGKYYPLVKALCDEIEAEGYIVRQAKDKFGHLTIYYGTADKRLVRIDEIEERINALDDVLLAMR